MILQFSQLNPWREGRTGLSKPGCVYIVSTEEKADTLATLLVMLAARNQTNDWTWTCCHCSWKEDLFISNLPADATAPT